MKEGVSDGQAPLDAVQNWADEMKSKVELSISRSTAFERIKGFVLCISAQYYAAVEMSHNLKGCKEKYGPFANKDDKTATISAGKIVEAAHAYIKQQRAKWLEMSTEERQKIVDTPGRKGIKGWALGLANVSICCVYWSLYFDPSATLCFKRDWKIGKEQAAFRNTWSAGWFIDILKTQKGVDLSEAYKQMQGVMALLSRSRQDRNKRTTDFRLTHSKVAFYVNDMVASHIGNITEMANHHRAIAMAKGVEMDEWIKAIEKEVKAMDGATEETKIVGFDFRIKGQESLERKLDSAIAHLLRQHAPTQGDGSYAPLESEIMRDIHDCLRYTIVIDTAIYYKGVKLIEQYLLDKNCVLEGKNYWQDPPDPADRQTMYMGLNTRVWLAPDPRAFHFEDARYPVELQLHTPQSLELKNGESHRLYEDIRTENVIARRDKLVLQAYKLWEDITVPTDDSMNPRSFAFYAGMNGTSFSDSHKTYGSRKKKKNSAVSRVQALMKELGVTEADLGIPQAAASSGHTHKKRVHKNSTAGPDLEGPPPPLPDLEPSFSHI